MYVNNYSITSLLLFLSACPAPAKKPTGPTPEEIRVAREDRGRYLVTTLGACAFCHTPLNPDGTRDSTRLFAGFSCFIDTDPADPNVGCLSSRNLTNHETGLANATDEQIKDAFQNGIATDGKFLAPVMPYWFFHNMSDEDADSVVAFLRTLPGVENRPTPSQPPWTNVPAAAAPVRDDQIPMPRADYPYQEEALEGRYLSAMAGLCMDCHTPDAPLGSDHLIDLSRPFAGGRHFFAVDLGLTFLPPLTDVFSENITPDTTGIPGYSVQDIVRAIKGGLDKNGGGVCAATHGAATSTYANLTDEDVTNIAHYIASLPPIANENPTQCTAPVAR